MVVYYAIAMALYMGSSTRKVLHCLLAGPPQLHLRERYERLLTRPAYQAHVAQPMS